MAKKSKEVQGLVNGDDKLISRIKTKLSTANKKIKARYAKTVQSLELEKERIDLELKIKELKITKPFQLNSIRNNPNIKDELRDQLVLDLETSIDKKIQVFEDQLNEVYNKIDQVEEIPKEDIQITKLKTLNLKTKFKEALYEQKNKVKRKPSFEDVVEAIAFVTTIILENVAVNNTRIERLVNDTNEIIFNVKTQTEFNNAKIKRETALNIIYQNDQFLTLIENIFKILDVLVVILSSMIEILSFFPFTLPLNKILLKFQNILNKINPLIKVYLIVLNKLKENLSEHKARLAELGKILEGTLEQVPQLISSLNSGGLEGSGFEKELGYLRGYDYKEFRFFIKEEPNPKNQNVIQGNKRRYAVALNKDDNEVLRSSYSFTLEPDVLVEELKLQIDQKGLVA
jgi:hypothetical protein